MTPVVFATETEDENKYDPVSSKAVTVDFRNDDDEWVGACSISAIDTDIPFFYGFGVSEMHRGAGYGTAIMQYVMDHYHPTQLSVETNNTIAISLYEKFGFKIVREYSLGDGTQLYEMNTPSHHPFEVDRPKSPTDPIDITLPDPRFRHG